MNNTQLDMVLGYLNEGTEIDEISWLIESINEEINRFEIVSIDEAEESKKKGFLSKIKELLNKIVKFIRNLINKFKSFISGLFKKNKATQKIVVQKAKSVDAPNNIDEAIEKDENKSKVENVQKRQVDLARKLTGDENYDVSKLGNSEFLVMNWNIDFDFGIDDLEKLVSKLSWYFNTNSDIEGLERDADSIKYRYQSADEQEVSRSTWKHHVEFRKMNASDFVNPRTIINQYNLFEKTTEKVKKLIDRYEKISKEIEEIAKKSDNEEFANEEYIGKIREMISYVQKETSVCSKALNDIMITLKMGSEVTTQNYKVLLNCIKE